MKKKAAGDTEHPQGHSLPVYGEDAEGNIRRGFDCLLIDGEPYIETVSRNGCRIKTPVSSAIAAFMLLEEDAAGLS